MLDKPSFIRLVATLLLGALIVSVVFGIANWGEIKPKPPAESGKVVLAICGLASAAGIWILWRPQNASAS